MAKKLFIGILLASVLTVNVFPARAVEDILTDAQITSIRTHCTEIQGSLNRLRQTDTLLRTNRGQLYRTIGDRLMTPFNQRIASNRLDGSDLLKTSADYNSSYKRFYDAYKDYETALADARSVDCTKQQSIFYSKIMTAREKRIKLHEISERLVQLASQYRQQINSFKTNVEGQGQ